MAYDYQLLNVTIEGRIAWVTLDAPPINVITLPLYAGLAALSKELEADSSLTVVVSKSADPDFFLAHFDVGAILTFPTDTPAERDTELNAFHAMCERFRTMDKVTIAQIEGRSAAAAVNCRRRATCVSTCAAKLRSTRWKCRSASCPAAPVRSGLPRLAGRGRAMEIVLGADDLDAKPQDVGAI
jgi:enoyl-CoA hydratase/carnithine racemase